MTRRGKAGRAVLLAAAALCTAGQASAQISFANLAELRVGEDPDAGGLDGPANRFSRYEQFDFDSTHGPLHLGFRFESYVPSDRSTPEFNYDRFTRRFATWRGKSYAVTAGNYEATFGRGLVLRTFALPGVIREERGTPQFGDSRDLDGVRAEVRAENHHGALEFSVLQGRPRYSDETPTVPRSGSVEGAAGVASRGPARAGAHYVRIDSQTAASPGNTIETGGGFVQIGFDPWLQRAGWNWLSLDTYAEAGRAVGLGLPAAISSEKLDRNHGRAVYVSQTLTVDEVLPEVSWGASYEFKDYQNFQLGVNEPPMLVREHSFSLLNRTTHVVQLLQERGHQVESRLDWRQTLDATVNWSQADNRDGLEFRETYGELGVHWQARSMVLFAATADDGIESVRNRNTLGAYVQVPLADGHSAELELGRQRAERGVPGTVSNFEDRSFSVTYGLAGRGALAYVRQTTDDPDEATDPVTGQVSRREYDSVNASLTLGAHHELAMFWGRRRGGLACTAGTCYKVRPFDGVSARLTSRF